MNPSPLIIPPMPHFDQLIPDTCDTHGLVKLNKILNDIYEYALNMLQALTEAHAILDIKWCYEARASITRTQSTATALDKTLLKVPSIPTDSPIFTKFSEVCELVVEVQKSALEIRNKSDLAADYIDLTENVIRSVKVEIGTCLEAYRRLRMLVDSTSSSYDWDEVTQLLPLNSKTPPFSIGDETVYNDMQSLSQQLEPFDISLDIIARKIEDFSRVCADTTINDELVYNFNAVRIEYVQLMEELAEFKELWSRAKWREVVEFFIAGCRERLKNGQWESAEADSPFSVLLDGSVSLIRIVLDAIRIAKKYLEEVQDALLMIQYNELVLEWKDAFPSEEEIEAPSRVEYTGTSGDDSLSMKNLSLFDKSSDLSMRGQGSRILNSPHTLNKLTASDGKSPLNLDDLADEFQESHSKRFLSSTQVNRLLDNTQMNRILDNTQMNRLLDTQMNRLLSSTQINRTLDSFLNRLLDTFLVNRLLDSFNRLLENFLVNRLLSNYLGRQLVSFHRSQNARSGLDDRRWSSDKKRLSLGSTPEIIRSHGQESTTFSGSERFDRLLDCFSEISDKRDSGIMTKLVLEPLIENTYEEKSHSLDRLNDPEVTKRTSTVLSGAAVIEQLLSTFPQKRSRIPLMCEIHGPAPLIRKIPGRTRIPRLVRDRNGHKLTWGLLDDPLGALSSRTGAISKGMPFDIHMAVNAF